MDSSQWMALGEPDPEIVKLGDAVPLLDLDVADLPALRDMGNAQTELAMAALDRTGVDQTTIEIPSRDGTALPAIHLRPAKGPGEGARGGKAGPLVVLIHGGGWCIGTPAVDIPTALHLVRTHGASVVLIRYRLAPEHPFPTAVHDAWDAVKWCAANVSILGADPFRGFILGGESAGCNLTVVAAHLARDEGLTPPLTGLWLSLPVVMSPSAVPEEFRAEYRSWEQNANAPVINARSMENMFYKAYKPDHQSELFAPFNWASGHKGLPKAYFQVCGLDPFRDDGLLYERELRRQGVETRLDVYPGLPHAFHLLLPNLPQAKKFNADSFSGLKWLITGE